MGRTRQLRHFPSAFGSLLQWMMSLSRAARSIRSLALRCYFIRWGRHPLPPSPRKTEQILRQGRILYSISVVQLCIFTKKNTIPGSFSAKLKECLGLCRVCYAEGRAGRFNDRFHLFNDIQDSTSLSLYYTCTVITLLCQYHELYTFFRQAFHCPAQWSR